MPNNTTAPIINVTELDFDTIKSNLKEYLRNRTEFTDIDFEGSGVNYILDLLAYNTHLTAFYGSMIGNESFLDSAVLRNSVVSRSKLLGYLPRSRRSGKAIVALDFAGLDPAYNDTYPSFVTIPAGAIFVGLGSLKNYTFSTREAVISNRLTMLVDDRTGVGTEERVVYTNISSNHLYYYYGGGVSHSSSTTCILDTNTWTTNVPNNAFVGNSLRILDGVGEGQTTLITAYDNSTRVVSFYPPLNIKPTNTGSSPTKIEILPTILVELYEGEPLQMIETSNGLALQSFAIENQFVDTSSIRVTVLDNDGESSYIQAQDKFVLLDSESKVFFLEETDEGLYNISFGDGIIGAIPPQNSTITINYAVSSGEETNGIRHFKSVSSNYIMDSLGRRWTSLVNCVSPCAGGTNLESIDSIKFMAPMQFSAQNRAITKSDYETLIVNNFSSVDSISVWGGETNDPPLYGTIFVAIKPKEGYYINDNYKSRILQNLRTYSIICLDHKIVDPDYVYLMCNSIATYDSRLITLTEDQLKSNIVDSIYDYGQNTLDNFKLSFRLSRFVEHINGVDTAIVSNKTSFLLKKKIYPTLGVLESHTLKFPTQVNVLAKPFVYSNSFVYYNYTAWFENGTVEEIDTVNKRYPMHIYYRNSSFEKTILQENVGWIYYETGKLEINSFVPDDFTSTLQTSIDFVVVPDNHDINPLGNQILVIDSDDIFVNVYPLERNS
jgi:hypothetical protein